MPLSAKKMWILALLLTSYEIKVLILAITVIRSKFVMFLKEKITALRDVKKFSKNSLKQIQNRKLVWKVLIGGIDLVI